jgi:hypothetical protein
MNKASPGIIVLNFLLVFAPTLRPQTSEPPLAREKPIWEKGNRAIGYRSWSLWGELSWVGSHHVKILFPDEGHLALAWVLPGPSGESPAGAIPLPNTPCILHLQLLDSKTGSRAASHDWNLTSHTVDLVSAKNGQWIVKVDQQARIYSADFVALHEDAVADWHQFGPIEGEEIGVLAHEDVRINSTSTELALVKTDGQALFHHVLPENQKFAIPITMSASGSTFAALITRKRGIDNPDVGLNAVQVDDRVVVYSVRSRGPVLSVKVKGMSPWRRGGINWNTIALSPEGHLLAIASNEDIRVYEVPEPPGTK